MLGREGKPIEFKLNKDGCHIVTSHVSNKDSGYFNIIYRDNMVMLHEYIWMCYNGTISKDVKLVHKCGNKKCINTKHMKIVVKSHPETKLIEPRQRGRHLSKAQCFVIYSQYDITSRKELALRFNTTDTTIRSLQLGLHKHKMLIEYIHQNPGYYKKFSESKRMLIKENLAIIKPKISKSIKDTTDRNRKPHKPHKISKENHIDGSDIL